MKTTTAKGLGPALSLCLCGLLASCAPNLVTPVSQANPNPLVGAKRFEVKDVRYVDLRVDGKSEDAYKAGIGEEAWSDWDEDKRWIARYFVDHVQSSAAAGGVQVQTDDPGAPFVIVPTVSMIDTGYYRIPAWNAVSRVNYNVSITDRSGKRIDQVEAVHGIPFDAILAPSTSGRLQKVAAMLGDSVGEYVVERTGG